MCFDMFPPGILVHLQPTGLNLKVVGDFSALGLPVRKERERRAISQPITRPWSPISSQLIHGLSLIVFDLLSWLYKRFRPPTRQPTHPSDQDAMTISSGKKRCL